MRAVFQRQLRQIELWLVKQPNVHTLFVDYEDVLQDAAATAKAVNAFVGADLDLAAMTVAVDSALHRQRRVAPAGDSTKVRVG